MTRSLSSIVDNLKTQHITMILVSLALFSPILFGQPVDTLRQAKAEAYTIQNITSHWDPTYPDSIGLRYYDMDYFGDGLRPWEMVISPPELELGRYGNSFIINSYMVTLPDWEHEEHGVKLNIAAPRTLREFEVLWNKSLHISYHYIEDLKDYAYIQVNSNSAIQKITLQHLGWLQSNVNRQQYDGVFCKNIFNTSDVEPEDASLIGLAFSQNCFAQETGIISGGYLDFPKIWIPAISTPDRPEDGTHLICQMSESEYRECNNGLPFEQAFPNLYLSSENLRNLPIDSLIQELENQALTNDNDKFDFLGIRLPIGRLNSLGSILLSVLLINFYIHLHELNKLMKNRNVEIDSTWIALFSSKLARIVTFITLTFLPMGYILVTNFQVFTTLYREWASVPQFLVIGTFWYIAIYLPVLFLFEFLEIWKKLDTDGPVKATHENRVKRRNRN